MQNYFLNLKGILHCSGFFTNWAMREAHTNGLILIEII